MASQAIGPRILLVIDLYLLQTGNEKPVCYEKIWDETMSFSGMVCPGRAIEERNETSPKNLRNSSPMLLGRLCCWRVFFLKVGAFVFTPPEHGHETWILQSYTFSNMWTSLPCPFLGDWDVQIHTGSDLELFSPRWSNSYRHQTNVSTFEGVFQGKLTEVRMGTTVYEQEIRRIWWVGVLITYILHHPYEWRIITESYHLCSSTVTPVETETWQV